MWDTMRETGWQWTSPTTFLTDINECIDVSVTPLPQILHMLRATQKRRIIKAIPPKRNDLGHLAEAGTIDMQATAAVWRSKGKGALSSRFDRALLAGFISGSLHTQQRMSRAGLAADPSPLCVYCNGLEEETQEHILLHCPCWAKHRKQLHELTSQEERAAWPPATRHCAIILQDSALTDAKVADAAAIEPPLFIAPTADSDSTAETNIIDDQGSTWLLAATDGACTDQAHELLARAGYGVYFGQGHSQNYESRLYGSCQNAQRAETAALLATREDRLDSHARPHRQQVCRRYLPRFAGRHCCLHRRPLGPLERHQGSHQRERT
jgi:hypothetical protein